MSEDKFIDAETPYSKDSNTFQEILNRQIRKTSDVLSGELILIQRYNEKTKQSYDEDKRIVAINHIRTTETLMKPFIKKDVQDELDKIEEDYKKFRIKLGEEDIQIYGKGTFKASTIMHDSKSQIYARLISYKVESYRKIFDLLIKSYHKNKQDIMKFSNE